MASVLPPPAKRQRREDLERSKTQQNVSITSSSTSETLRIQFLDERDGNPLTSSINIPVADATEKNLTLVLNTLLGREKDDFVPYRFRYQIPEAGTEVAISSTRSLADILSTRPERPPEYCGQIIAGPQNVFQVQRVNRLAHRIPGHGQPILTAQFSPATSSLFATGSGDKTARIWDTDTGTPKHKLVGHDGWVLCVSWSPDGNILATGSQDKSVRLWDPQTGNPVGGRPFTGHAHRVNALAWEPYHLWRDGTPRLASVSKDATVRIWIVNTGLTEHVLSGHRSNVSCVKWGGTGQIYTASHDKTVRVWDAIQGTLIHSFTSHVHWVNHLALSTDFALRTAFYDHTPVPDTEEGKRKKAKQRFEEAAQFRGKASERLVTASDDKTMYLWEPSQGSKPIARLLGHQNVVNHVTFSPNGALIASASFDNHTKIWSASDGKFIDTLRGHVSAVYQCSFSADSRFLVTSSKDTTLKVWSMSSYKLAADLPGHQDEVYAVDWSPDGKQVGSGGKDKAVRLWRH